MALGAAVSKEEGRAELPASAAIEVDVAVLFRRCEGRVSLLSGGERVFSGAVAGV